MQFPRAITDGQYTPWNLEMPLYLPGIERGAAFMDDPPLTMSGEASAQMYGNKLAETCNIRVTKAFTSPALRCITTCYRILKGEQTKNANKPELPSYRFSGQADFLGYPLVNIKIDGTLYEMGNVATGAVNFSPPKFYATRGIPIDTDYKFVNIPTSHFGLDAKNTIPCSEVQSTTKSYGICFGNPTTIFASGEMPGWIRSSRHRVSIYLF